MNILHSVIHTFLKVLLKRICLTVKSLSSWWPFPLFTWPKPFNSQDFISDSPYCLLYNLFDVSLENLELDQPIIPKLIFFYILITYLVDIVLILWGEILSWSLMGVKGLKHWTICHIFFIVLRLLCNSDWAIEFHQAGMDYKWKPWFLL